MSRKEYRDTVTVHREKAVLVSVELPRRPWLSDDPLDELRGLTTSAGADVVGELTQRRQEIEPASYIGKGKLQELVELVKSVDADVIVFDNELSPAQTRNLETATSIKVIDRSELIMDIFASRARTPAAKLQVELAQLEYSLPRLKRMWTHLSRYKGGIGLRGPGETQLEEDRRLVEARIQDLKGTLEVVQGRKEREVQTRRAEFTVSLVGYTNAGKSSLMNKLTGADVYVEDKLFSTLDTRTRRWKIPEWGTILLSDTVGFIRYLPHHLVESFKATLEEARQAKLLLHVVDASSPQAEEHIKAVVEVLKEVGCEEKPAILVLNKIDKLSDEARGNLSQLEDLHKTERIVEISARSGKGLDELAREVASALSADFVNVTLKVKQSNGKALAYIESHADVYNRTYEGEETLYQCHIPRPLLEPLQRLGVEVADTKN